MSLPKIEYPIFELVLPSNKTKVTFRPFTVKEEKLLLIAQESEDQKERIRAIRQIINNCCFDLPKDIGLLPSFDLIYCFLKIRSKSVGNIIEVKYKDLTDEKIYTFDIDLDELEIVFNDKHNPNIKISENLGLIMTYPTIEMLEKTSTNENSTDALFNLIKQCVSAIYDSDTVYETKDYTLEEISTFVESIPAKAFEDITIFFDTMPELRHELTYKDSEGTEKKIILQGIDDFFQ
jgi:T4 bacteriophage base plate protein